ncbi:MAG TPA: zf-TFIIB domain-containing protein [Myxococcaceae bacterium]|nr:zf-TFIIB domain-containing protein [Myxococcaceae bacterium]
MDCPSCNVEMTDLEGDDEKLRVCQDCGGLWVDVADLNRMLLHHGLPGLESLGGHVDPGAETGVCRDCLIDLTRVKGGDRHDPQHYETCESCGGIFVGTDADPADTSEAAKAAIVSAFRQFAGTKRAKPAG